MRAHRIGIAFFQKGEDQLSVAKADEVAKLGDPLVSALQKDALRLCCGLNSKVFAGEILQGIEISLLSFTATT